MGIFGWSYPPGCSGPPDYGDYPCPVCGGKNDDDCICPECQECGDFGNPECYEKHGLVRSQEQIDRLAEREAQWEKDAEAEALYQDELAKHEEAWTAAEAKAHLKETIFEDI